MEQKSRRNRILPSCVEESVVISYGILTAKIITFFLNHNILEQKKESRIPIYNSIDKDRTYTREEMRGNDSKRLLNTTGRLALTNLPEERPKPLRVKTIANIRRFFYL